MLAWKIRHADSMPSRDRRDAAGALHHICFNGNDRGRIILGNEARFLSYADLDTHSHVYVRMSEPKRREYVAFIDAWRTRVHTRERREEVAVQAPG